jgi:hypothetical protein
MFALVRPWARRQFNTVDRYALEAERKMGEMLLATERGNVQPTLSVVQKLVQHS